MKKIVLIIVGCCFVLIGAFGASADSFDFYGVDQGGIGSAHMEITVIGSVLTMALDNTSPCNASVGNGESPVFS